MARTVRGRSFGVPRPFTAGHLMAMGVAQEDTWPVPAIADRCVVISPFLDVGTIRRLPAGTTIVSRPEAFDRVGATVLDGHDLRVLQPHADATEEDIDAGTEDDPTAAGTSRPFEVKSGLHAKVLAWDIGDSSRLLTGSANATSAAFGGNIEFGVMLAGRPGTAGAAAILKDSDKETGFSRLLQPYVAKDQPEADLEFDLEREIEEFHVALAAAGAAVHVEGAEDGAFALRLAFARQPVEVGRTWVRPVTLKPSDDRPLGDETTWEGRGYNDVTPFIAVRTRLERDGVSVERASAIRADLIGAPEDRARRVLARAPQASRGRPALPGPAPPGPEPRRRRRPAPHATNDDDEGGSDAGRSSTTWSCSSRSSGRTHVATTRWTAWSVCWTTCATTSGRLPSSGRISTCSGRCW